MTWFNSMAVLVLDIHRFMSALFVKQEPQFGKEVLSSVVTQRFFCDTAHSLTIQPLLESVTMEKLLPEVLENKAVVTHLQSISECDIQLRCITIILS